MGLTGEVEGSITWDGRPHGREDDDQHQCPRLGSLINDSEEPVRQIGHEFLRAAFEAALQQKIDAAQAAFPPPQCTGTDPVTKISVTKRMANKGKRSRTILSVLVPVKVVWRWWHVPLIGCVAPVDEVIDPSARPRSYSA